jgi:hypothetical protein
VKVVVFLILACAAVTGCAGKYEQLAKCSTDENPVPSMGYVSDAKESREVGDVFLAVTNEDDCGPMRPVNPF